MTPDFPGSPPEDQEGNDLVCRWVGCGLSFDSLEELVSHLTASHVTSQHGAFYCLWRGCARTKGFNARYKMLIHIRTHTNERPYACAECDKRFSRQENLRIHARTHTGEKPYVCTVPGCGKAYSNSSDRFKHTRTHFVDKPYECRHPGCGKRYTDPSSLRKHVKIYGHARRPEEAPSGVVHEPNVEQALAAAAAAARLSPSPSSSGSSSLGPSPIPPTPSTFLSPSLFHTAAAASAAAGLGPSGLPSWAPPSAVDTANLGAVTAAAAWTVALHQYRAGLFLSGGAGGLEIPSGEEEEEEDAEEEEEDDDISRGGGLPGSAVLDLSVCPSPLDLSLPSARSRNQWVGCGLSFDSLEELVSHLTASHVTLQHGAFYCLWRGCARTKGFNARYKMLIHIRTHTNERPYACAECDKRFSRQENLRIHARTHTGEKPYVCTVPGCGKAYSNSSDRFKHTRTHFVDKPYECRHPGCGKRYTDPSSLRKHVKIYGHARRPEEAPSGVVHEPNVEQALAAAAAAARLSPSPSSSGSSSLGPSPIPPTPSTFLSPSLFHTAAAASAAAGLGPSGLPSWAPPSAVDTANLGAVTAAAAWTVALHQYRAGLFLSGGAGGLEIPSGEEEEEEEAEEEEEDDDISRGGGLPGSAVLDLSVCPSPLDLSLPSARSRNQ